MKGFDPKFKDFPDYIIGITKEIWEDRGIATLHDYYAPDIVVRSPASVVVGNQDVIAATMATLAEFPDRTLFGEDVIWCGTPEEGMLSSHRLHSTATHAHPGVYGAPTGKKLHYRILADCHAINNQINDEWLIRDQGAIVRQLGHHPKDFARDLIAKGPRADDRPFHDQRVYGLVDGLLQRVGPRGERGGRAAVAVHGLGEGGGGAQRSGAVSQKLTRVVRDGGSGGVAQFHSSDRGVTLNNGGEKTNKMRPCIRND